MKNMMLGFVVLALTCGLALAQQYKVLWSFGGSQGDGVSPIASLVFDRAGNLYGTTEGGGTYGQGAVFELSPNPDGSWSETLLYSFCPSYPQFCVDGENPRAGLLLDSSGNLYGTTYYGGTSGLCGTGTCGTVFELSPPSAPGSAWSESVLYSFCSNFVNHRCLDGFSPASQLIAGGTGVMYGTTTYGGSGHSSGGTVFKLSRRNGNWQEAVLYNFCSLGQGEICPDGNVPSAGVVLDKSGNFYGATESGGAKQSEGAGTIYELSPGLSNWTETVLGTAGSQFENGAVPLGTASVDALGNVYSTASEGGDSGNGTVFKLGPNGGVTVLSFGEANEGGLPAAGVLLDPKRARLYGTTKVRGTGQGNVYQIAPPAQISSLYNFCSQTNCTDGMWPVANLIEDQFGNLYGTTEFGGGSNLCQSGCGVVFEIVQSPYKS